MDIPLLAANNRPGDIPGWLFLIVIAPYFFLIHIGLLIWVISSVKKLIGHDYSLNISIAKVIGTLHGAGVGFLLPFLENYYHPYDHPTLAVIADLPAFFLTAHVESEGLKFYAPYVFFGLLGGWGLGQLFDAILNRIRRNHGNIVAAD